jgi:D-alanyl-D-alanine dipeptidase
VRALTVFLFAIAFNASAQASPVPSDCRQLVVVTTKSWTSVEAELRCFQRDKGGKWHQHGNLIEAVVGHNGLRLASEIKGAAKLEPDRPLKEEGDGCSPAGVLGLPYAFGYAPAEEARWIKLPYVQCTNTFECVDDGHSIYYNQVIDSRFAAKHDWKSSEQMLRKDVLYRWGVFVDHNPKKERGGGSCIFLHIWSGAHKGTTGCSAMDEIDLKRLIGWLDPTAKPLLVQFPESVYKELQKPWQLPDVKH